MNCALILVAAELLSQTGFPAVARNKTGTTDFAWVQIVGMAEKIYYKRGETPCCSNVSPTDFGSGYNPDCDIDDDTSVTGQLNSAVVWQNGDQLYLCVNATTTIQVGLKSDNMTYEVGGQPRVAITRTGGRVVVTWESGSPTVGSIFGQLYQIGTGSSVTKLSHPFSVSTNVNGLGMRNGGVSCGDNGNFVAGYYRRPYNAQPPMGTPTNSKGVVARGFVMPTSFTAAPTENFPEVSADGNDGYMYRSCDVACYADGGFVIAWNAAPKAQRYTVSGGSATFVTNSDIDIVSGCTYPHPCRTFDGTCFNQEPYIVSVGAQRCTPGNYAVVYHARTATDNWETYRLKVCEDLVRTNCSEDVMWMAVSDGYPEPDRFQCARVAMDDCGRMVSVFWGSPFGSGWDVYTYLESLCDSCETECVSELEPCLEIPLPDCANDPLLSAVKRAVTKPAALVAATLAAVPVEPKGTRPAIAASAKPNLPTRVVKLEPKPIKASIRKKPTRTTH